MGTVRASKLEKYVSLAPSITCCPRTFVFVCLGNVFCLTADAHVAKEEARKGFIPKSLKPENIIIAIKSSSSQLAQKWPPPTQVVTSSSPLSPRWTPPSPTSSSRRSRASGSPSSALRRRTSRPAVRNPFGGMTPKWQPTSFRGRCLPTPVHIPTFTVIVACGLDFRHLVILPSLPLFAQR